MVRMAIRGLFARKLRTRPDRLRRRHRRRLRGGHVHLHGHDQRVLHRPVRARRRRASTSTSPPSSPSRATSAAGSSRCPPGTLEKVEAADGVEAAEARFETDVSIFDDEARADRRQRPAARSCSRRNEERFDPLTYVEGGPGASSPAQVTLDEATADRERLRGRRQDPRRPAASRREQLRDRPASRRSATRSRSASRA